MLSRTKKHSINVEVKLKSHVPDHEIPAVQELVSNVVERRCAVFKNGPLEFHDQPKIEETVLGIDVSGAPSEGCSFFETQVEIFTYRLGDDGPQEEISEGDDAATMYIQWTLPAREFDGLWESLVFEEGLKENLVDYMHTSLLFSNQGVAQSIISWNHVVLLHGPPGTGKTSLCKALAQKCAIRLQSSFQTFQLLEINAHSLFSKWFSESGKMVGRLFEYIRDMVEDESNLVFILIDEVESLAASRQSSNGSDPSDAMRVVNALLTQLDQLKSCPNAMILSTSNITEAIDVAFVDRADIKQFIGLPGNEARYRILVSCLQELMRVGIIQPKVEIPQRTSSLLEVSQTQQGSTDALNAILFLELIKVTEQLSGRALRKLPFQAHAYHVKQAKSVELNHFLQGLYETALRIHEERSAISGSSHS